MLYDPRSVPFGDLLTMISWCMHPPTPTSCVILGRDTLVSRQAFRVYHPVCAAHSRHLQDLLADTDRSQAARTLHLFWHETQSPDNNLFTCDRCGRTLSDQSAANLDACDDSA